MTTALMGSAGVWIIATGVYFGLGGHAAVGFAGMAVYLGVCFLGGTLCGRYL